MNIDRRKVADILYKVWKSKLSITNGSTEIEAIVNDYAKAYAAAQVEESVSRQQPIFDAAMNAKNAEIKRLREEAEQMHSYLPYSHPLRVSPAPVTEDEFSIGAYAPECSPTFEQLTENDNLAMMQRLEKRMLPFHKIDSPKNEDHHE